MPMSEAKRKANKRWNDENMAKKYDRLSVLIPKGRKQAVEAHAKSKGESINGMVNRAILSDMGLTEWPEGKEESNEP